MNRLLPRTFQARVPTRLSAADFARLMREGAIGEDDRVELIHGEPATMAAKSLGHDQAKNVLARRLGRALPESLVVAVETTIQLTDDCVVEPDIAVFPASAATGDLDQLLAMDGADILLLIEVSLSSLRHDRDVKGPLYAGAGIREFWLVDAAARTVEVHADPRDGAWTRRERHAFGAALPVTWPEGRADILVD